LWRVGRQKIWLTGLAELEAVVARLEPALAAREAEVAAKDNALIDQKDRTAELEK